MAGKYRRMLTGGRLMPGHGRQIRTRAETPRPGAPDYAALQESFVVRQARLAADRAADLRRQAATAARCGDADEAEDLRAEAAAIDGTPAP
jgi:hypothetical protein